MVIVAGIGRNRALGLGGKLPWHAPEDLKFFKRHTVGTALVMGRKTFDSIGRPLPGRVNVVVTRDPEAFEAAHPGVVARATLREAIGEASRRAHVVTVGGGGVIYREALPLADEMLLTFHDYDGPFDVSFPEWDPREWEETSREAVGSATAVRYRRVTTRNA